MKQPRVDDLLGNKVTNAAAGTAATDVATRSQMLATVVEIDFGIVPTSSGSWTIIDAAVASTSNVVVTPSGRAAGGRVGNDWAFDAAQFSTVPANGTFTLSALCTGGRMVGKRNIQYEIR